MYILIIEDENYKFEDLKKSLENLNSYINIDRRISQNGGLNAICENKYDLVILDMQIPLYESGEYMQMFGGRHILKRLQHKEIDVPVCMCSSNFYDENGTFFSIRYDPIISLEEDLKEMFREYNLLQGLS